MQQPGIYPSVAGCGGQVHTAHACVNAACVARPRDLKRSCAIACVRSRTWEIKSYVFYLNGLMKKQIKSYIILLGVMI